MTLILFAPATKSSILSSFIKPNVLKEQTNVKCLYEAQLSSLILTVFLAAINTLFLPESSANVPVLDDPLLFPLLSSVSKSGVRKLYCK